MTLTSLTYSSPIRRRTRTSRPDYELLETAAELATQGKPAESLAKVIDHLLPGVAHDLTNAPLQFIQGSSKVSLRIDGDEVAVTTPLVRLPTGGSAIAALRFVLTKLAANGQLHQPRLRGDDIFLEYRDKLTRMHPAKMLEVLRRMPVCADYYDDWLIGEFKALPLDRAELEPVSADELARCKQIWHDHWNEIDELFKEAQRKRSLFFLNELTAYALHRIKFALPLNGFLAAKLAEAANVFNDTNEQPGKRETSLAKCLKDMKAVGDDELAKELGHATYAISPLADGSPKVISGYFRGGNYIDTIDQYRKSDKAMDAALALMCTYTFLLSRYSWTEAVDAAIEDGLAHAAGKPWREAADVLFHHAKDTLVAKFCGDEDEDHEAGEGERQGDAS
jgi:hypothetical protein